MLEKLAEMMSDLAKRFDESSEKEEVSEEVAMGRELFKEAMKPTGQCDTKRALQLIENGASIDVENNDDMTAFLFAAWNGHTEVFKALADKGANPDQEDGFWNTAIILAAKNGHEEIIEFLVNDLVVNGRRPDAEHKNYDGETAYSIATKAGNDNIVSTIENANRMSPKAIESAKNRAKKWDIPFS